MKRNLIYVSSWLAYLCIPLFSIWMNNLLIPIFLLIILHFDQPCSRGGQGGHVPPQSNFFFCKLYIMIWILFIIYQIWHPKVDLSSLNFKSWEHSWFWYSTIFYWYLLFHCILFFSFLCYFLCIWLNLSLSTTFLSFWCNLFHFVLNFFI